MVLGLSLPALRAFAAEQRIDARAQTHEVQSLLRKLADGEKSCYAEAHFLDRLRQPREAATAASLGVPRVGRATHLVVHAHSRPFVKLLEALENYTEMHVLDASATFFWVDCFCVRTHDAQDVAKLMGEITRQIGLVALVFDPWNRPVCLRRTWCLYELAHARANGAKVHLATSRSGARELRLEAFKQDIAAVRTAFLDGIDVRNSSASLETEKRMLLDLIRANNPSRQVPGDDAFERLNGEVRAAVRAAFDLHLTHLSSFVHSTATGQAADSKPALVSHASSSALAEIEREVERRMSIHG
ncbi:hypothetical protein T492DRAFT_968399 [Pavlovales sp. CCMP2436]|nr:hypothetical protein T492DRAFT_968399 [Pavlovales sp. CCMP2436]